jgi:hypothetical protein
MTLFAYAFILGEAQFELFGQFIAPSGSSSTPLSRCGTFGSRSALSVGDEQPFVGRIVGTVIAVVVDSVLAQTDSVSRDVVLRGGASWIDHIHQCVAVIADPISPEKVALSEFYGA